jgi:hypothetical protein
VHHRRALMDEGVDKPVEIVDSQHIAGRHRGLYGIECRNNFAYGDGNPR